MYLIALALGGCEAPAPPLSATLQRTLDRENAVDGRPLTSSTQSLNRYRSVLRDLDEVSLHVDERLHVRLHGDGIGTVEVSGIDPAFLTPVLPYAHGPRTDAFDRANLFLAEFARSGVSVAYQAHNRLVGVFHDDGQVFEDVAEYRVVDGQLQPVPRVRPRRLTLVNNCLQTGLWEISAADSVGEMFHAWLTVPDPIAVDLVRRVNGLDDGDAVLTEALAYREDLGPVAMDLDRLRRRGRLLQSGPTQLANDKAIGGYSTQDSRRKVQRGFFRVERPGAGTFAPQWQRELAAGDRFRLHAFVPPGVYVADDPQRVPFDPGWSRAEIRRVEPLTAYPGQRPVVAPLGTIELTLHHRDGRRGIVVGNVPVDLLVTQEDFAVPAFGAGVHRPAELVERRLLRTTEGPRPSFAYLFDRQSGTVLNNHEAGIEQVFLRPFVRDDGVWLRVTLVAYERIVDLLELEVALEAEVSAGVVAASRAYRPPPVSRLPRRQPALRREPWSAS
ncbi:MAG: hypothetical protein AAF602_11335 [Myxococcota bacterium]